MNLNDYEKTNKIIRYKRLITDELSNNDIKSKNNILFDEFVEDISKNRLLSKENTSKVNNDLCDLKLLKIPDIKHYFNSEQKKLKYNSIIII